jgi:thiamine-monophosphate kinase
VDDRTLLREVMEIIGAGHCLDDCAVLPYGGGYMVATTDMLHETTDFPAGMTDWQAGWMSAAVTISDIAAMGADPAYLLIAVGLDRWERLREVMRGAKDCCDRSGASIVGGDIDRHQELTIVTTGLGTVEKDRIVRRSGSRVGDAICVTGTPGRAQAALEGYHIHDPALFEPQPRVREGRILGASGITSMMDVSDGIALSLHDLLLANSCGYSVQTDLLPLPEGVPEQAARELALYGGGDYELLFTCPKDRLPIQGVEYHRIGEVIAEHVALADGMPLEKRGYQHRWD